MPNVQHRMLTAASGIHVLQAWEAANAAARTAIVGVAADVGKVCRQADDGSFWVLTAAPSTWTRIDAAAGASTALKYLTWSSERPGLPNSFYLAAGSGITITNPSADRMEISSTGGGSGGATFPSFAGNRNVAASDAGGILVADGPGTDPITLTLLDSQVIAAGASFLVLGGSVLGARIKPNATAIISSALNPSYSSGWQYVVAPGASALVINMGAPAWYITGTYDIEGLP